MRNLAQSTPPRRDQIPPPRRLFLTSEHYQEMRTHIEKLVPEEACGLIGGIIQGDAYLAKVIIPVSNALHSPTCYRMDPSEQLTAFEKIEAQGWEMIGIYHSHPAGPDQPSPTDIAEAFYPEAVYLIWFHQEGGWLCKGFTIQNCKVEEIEVK
jgi:proteasome lid subunit RPN8/RPN11